MQGSFPLDKEGFPAGHQYFYRGTIEQQVLGQFSALPDQMFNVVEQKQAFFAAEVGGEGLEQRVARLFLQVKDGCHTLRYQAGIGQRSQLDQPDASGIVVDHLFRRRGASAGFSLYHRGQGGSRDGFGPVSL